MPTYDNLNTDQQQTFNACVYGTRSILCTGEGGTGKSTLIETLVSHYRTLLPVDNSFIAVTASTGVAAYHIKGITLHRFAGVGIEESDIPLMIKRASSGVSRGYWKKTSVLIIDEISMISAQFFDALSLVAQNIRESNLPFGGIRLLMFGDFLQLPPVSRSRNSTPRVFQSDVWSDLDPNILQLTTIVRQSDVEFTTVLSELRKGVCTLESEHYIKSLSREIEYSDGVDPVRLFAKRDTTDSYNSEQLNKLTNSIRSFVSTDSGDSRILNQCPAPACLKLTEGAQVMLIRNLTTSAVNGSVGTVIGFTQTSTPYPIIKFIMPDGSSYNMTIGKCVWESIAPNGMVLSKRVQVPLILAWAMTIHKSQGQTIPRLYVDMNGIFEYGQAYVALSRCSSPENLQVVNFKKHLIMADKASINFYESINDCNSESGESATYVAPLTEKEWDNTIADMPPIGNHTIDTQLMLGNLSLQETSNSSQQDSDI